MFLDAAFFNDLSNKTELGGSILLDLTAGAKISQSSISNGGDYGSVDVFLRVNNFIATAGLSASSLNLDFPLSLPTGGLSTVEALILELEDGSFNMDVYLNLTKPTNITELFEGGELSNFEFGGSLDVVFPVKLTIEPDSLELGFTLTMTDDDIFTQPLPVITYELDICPLVDSLKDAITGLSGNILDVISNAASNISPAGLYINHDQLTKPLMTYVNKTLSNFTDNFVDELELIDCATDRRFLQETNSSLRNIMDAAIDNINDILNSSGITINAIVLPYFDSTNFAVGIDTEFSVVFELVRHLGHEPFLLHEFPIDKLYTFLSMQDAFEIIDLVGDFFDRIADEDSLSSSFLGLGNSSVASFEVDLDLDSLANNTFLAANFDAMFRLGVSLKVLVLTLQHSKLFAV